MIRPSNGLVILNKDLQSGLVKKKNYDNLIEYWVYGAKESNLVLPKGFKRELKDRNDITLKSIIVCESNHITKKTDKGFFVNGVKFTEDDLKSYLEKTNRSAY